MAATEKQIGYVLYLAGKMGYDARSWIDSRLGKAMGLSMRERSGAGRLIDWLRKQDARVVSSVIDVLK